MVRSNRVAIGVVLVVLMGGPSARAEDAGNRMAGTMLAGVTISAPKAHGLPVTQDDAARILLDAKSPAWPSWAGRRVVHGGDRA